LVRTLSKQLLQTYRSKQSDAPYVFTPEEMNRRSLMNICLSYLVQGQEDQYLDLAKAQFEADQSYNDMISALSIISDTSNEPVKEDCLTQLYQQMERQQTCDEQLDQSQTLLIQ
jgi:aminopeptidase N